MITVDELFHALYNANVKTNPSWKPVTYSELLPDEKEFIEAACAEVNKILSGKA